MPLFRVLRVVALLAVLSALPVGFGLLRAYYSPIPPINEAVFPALRAIEAKCMAEPSQHATRSCLTIIGKMQDCNAGAHCPVEAYYCLAYKAGFEDDLPDLYQGSARPRC
jgi:hypothetical protein